MGFIESIGLVSAITAADAALKAANVELVGRENSKGSGFITIKIVGDVGAVNAAISVAKSVASNVARVWSVDVIPRPGDGLGSALVWNSETQGAGEWLASKDGGSVPRDSALASLPAHDMVVVSDDIPKPAIPQTGTTTPVKPDVETEKPGASTAKAAAPPTAEAGADEAGAGDARTAKRPPRRKPGKPGGRGKKPK
jgi:microcompartment protein CcmL/EutN